MTIPEDDDSVYFGFDANSRFDDGNENSLPASASSRFFLCSSAKFTRLEKSSGAVLKNTNVILLSKS